MSGLVESCHKRSKRHATTTVRPRFTEKSELDYSILLDCLENIQSLRYGHWLPAKAPAELSENLLMYIKSRLDSIGEPNPTNTLTTIMTSSLRALLICSKHTIP
jgi:hypothetical protein